MNAGEINVKERSVELAPMSTVVMENTRAVTAEPYISSDFVQDMQNLISRAGGCLSKFYAGNHILPLTKAQYLESLMVDLRQIEGLLAQFLEFPKLEAGEYRATIEKDESLLKKASGKKCDFNGLIGDSSPMQGVYEMIEKIADTDTTILISGESGTGKELVAKILHLNSRRASGAFVPLNCAAIPKDLLESELFGHEKGSFTGALNTRIGRFERAHGGTLFLDEIGELEPSLQVKLLRVLQEREFERVGGVKTIKVDVRILAATNKDLERAMKENRFREDLYYRLHVIPVSIPPLRERAEDIPLLVDYFNRQYSYKRGRESLTFSPDAMQCLMGFSWPGNVRELENLIERLVILTSGSLVRTSDLPEKFIQHTDSRKQFLAESADLQDIAIPEVGIDMNAMLNTMERSLILKALEKTGWVKNRAAKLLGLNRTTLIEKMKKMEIELQRTEVNTPNY
jgi:transcriptional regulator with GAF, ATPase, and Fis domain